MLHYSVLLWTTWSLCVAGQSPPLSPTNTSLPSEPECVSRGLIVNTEEFCNDWRSVCEQVCGSERAPLTSNCTFDETQPFGVKLQCLCGNDKDLSYRVAEALIPAACRNLFPSPSDSGDTHHASSTNNEFATASKGQTLKTVRVWGDAGRMENSACAELIPDDTVCMPALDTPRCSGSAYVQCIPSEPEKGHWLNTDCPDGTGCLPTPGGFTCVEEPLSPCPLPPQTAETSRTRAKRRMKWLRAVRSDTRPRPARLGP
ncbi:hypothetical protein DFS34DRAFT_489751 [Phlyctochytrium arcticum]|nr:hypothetical protein DFS34DRAFT_489751 [Phlyctochytrium arcticum]